MRDDGTNYKLDDQLQGNSPDDDYPKRIIKRRSKKDKAQRNYVCGCGKQYLSYPALYTHLKTKHQGQLPQGTKNHHPINQKRGRPKKV